MKRIVLLIVLLTSVLNVSAQLKVGGKKIDTKKVVSAASDVASAITLSDDDIVKMNKEYMEWMDAHNPIADPAIEQAQRLERMTAHLTNEAGMNLNFKVYWVVDVNAFACADGSIRVFAGLMDIMTDDEIMAVIGHEIGHVVHADVKNAIKNAYLTSAARNAAGAASGSTIQKLTDSQLGDLAEALAGA